MGFRTSSQIYLHTDDVQFGPARIDLYDTHNDRWVPLGYSNNVKITVDRGEPAYLEGVMNGSLIPFEIHQTACRAEITGNIQELLSPQAMASLASGNPNLVFETDDGIGIEQISIPLHNYEWQEIPASIAIYKDTLPPITDLAVVGGTSGSIDDGAYRVIVWAVYLNNGGSLQNYDAWPSAPTQSGTTVLGGGNNGSLTITFEAPVGVKPSGYIGILYESAVLTDGVVLFAQEGGEPVAHLISDISTLPTAASIQDHWFGRLAISSGYVDLSYNDPTYPPGSLPAFGGSASIRFPLLIRQDNEYLRGLKVDADNLVLFEPYLMGRDYDYDVNTGYVRRIPGSTIPNHAHVVGWYPVRVRSQYVVRFGAADASNDYYGVRIMNLGTDENGYGEGWAFYFLKCFLLGAEWSLEATGNSFYEGSPFRFLACFPREASIPALGYARRWSGILSEASTVASGSTAGAVDIGDNDISIS